ncbi:hypothetical protein FZEAL_341 [Fusarium zealandicum]|uniref:Uncharacterized protein n=1 Tax=Fusarium zealandicum TaxID=1053134 RepID=A0A8H4XQZ7_9HYPO|nr:hypothetical protein FZEAL_341 [Fusarium zealandicum]
MAIFGMFTSQSPKVISDPHGSDLTQAHKLSTSSATSLSTTHTQTENSLSNSDLLTTAANPKSQAEKMHRKSGDHTFSKSHEPGQAKDSKRGPAGKGGPRYPYLHTTQNMSFFATKKAFRRKSGKAWKAARSYKSRREDRENVKKLAEDSMWCE